MFVVSIISTNQPTTPRYAWFTLVGSVCATAAVAAFPAIIERGGGGVPRGVGVVVDMHQHRLPILLACACGARAVCACSSSNSSSSSSSSSRLHSPGS